MTYQRAAQIGIHSILFCVPYLTVKSLKDRTNLLPSMTDTCHVRPGHTVALKLWVKRNSLEILWPSSGAKLCAMWPGISLQSELQIPFLKALRKMAMSHCTEMGASLVYRNALNDHCMAGPECFLQNCHQMATTGLIPNGHWGLALNSHCNAEAPRTFCRWTDGGCNSFFPSENKGSFEVFCVPYLPLPFYFIVWKWFRYCQKGFLLGGCKSSWLSAFLGYAI